MTEFERILWSKIKNKQLKSFQFNRQKIIGKYIADFYCAKANLIVEIDGGDHFTTEHIDSDIKRDEYFKSLGLKILRFTNIEIRTNLTGVIFSIYEYLEEIPLPPLIKGESLNNNN